MLPRITAAAALVLAACAHNIPVVTSEGGEVARTLVAAPTTAAGATYRPIALTELAPPAAKATVAPVASFRGATAPAAAPRAEVWNGTYEGGTYGQRGALALVLRPAPDGSLRGVVAWRVARSASNANEAVSLVRAPVVSTERDGEHLVLRLDEFFDPACNCTAHATFRGALRGDTLSGRFSIDGAATVVVEERGRWRAVRTAP